MVEGPFHKKHIWFTFKTTSRIFLSFQKDNKLKTQTSKEDCFASIHVSRIINVSDTIGPSWNGLH